MANPWDDRVYCLVRAFYSDKTPPTPSALALRAYLVGEGQLQVGSDVVPGAGCTWLRPLRGGRWYTDREATQMLSSAPTQVAPLDNSRSDPTLGEV